jgi:hypothetical protein
VFPLLIRLVGGKSVDLEMLCVRQRRAGGVSKDVRCWSCGHGGGRKRKFGLGSDKRAGAQRTLLTEFLVLIRSSAYLWVAPWGATSRVCLLPRDHRPWFVLDKGEHSLGVTWLSVPAPYLLPWPSATLFPGYPVTSDFLRLCPALCWFVTDGWEEGLKHELGLAAISADLGASRLASSLRS